VGRPLCRENGSASCQSLSAVFVHCQVFFFFAFYMSHMFYVYTIYTRPLSAQVQYSRSCLRAQSQSQSYLTTDSQSASLSWCQATIRASYQLSFILEIILRQLKVCYFMAPSLTRGRVYNLLLLPGFANSVPLESESCGTQYHILLPQLFRLSKSGGPGPHIYIPQGQRGPVIPRGTGYPFHRLLRFAGLRRRYSSPPPEAEITLRPTVR
jgi:hypothetical protein